MRKSYNSNSKKFAAIVMAIMMIAVVLLSAFYISAEADHDCKGEDCPICACIQQCENILNEMGDGASQLIAATSIIFLIILMLFSARCSVQKTLVSIKVRLDN